MNKFAAVGNVLSIEGLYRTKRKINLIVIHCAATKADMDIGAKDIDRWHKERWGKRSGCGYHYVIRRDGTLEKGRYTDSIGAHVKGHNVGSVGACLAGGLDENGISSDDLYSKEQIVTLSLLVEKLKEYYPESKVLQHKELPYVNKSCACLSKKLMGKLR